MAQRYSSGIETLMISTLGRDPLGEKVMQYMKHNGLSTRGISINDTLPTGQVKVTLDQKALLNTPLKILRLGMKFSCAIMC